MNRCTCLIVAITLVGCGKKQAEPQPAQASGTATDASIDDGLAARQAQMDKARAAGAAGEHALAVARTAAAPDAGAAGDEIPADFWTGGCPKVLARLADCHADPAFLAALTRGMRGDDKKQQLAYVADTGSMKSDAARWCTELQATDPSHWEEAGFLDGRWDRLAAPEVLASCAALGAAIHDAGGMFGGGTDE